MGARASSGPHTVPLAASPESAPVSVRVASQRVAPFMPRNIVILEGLDLSQIAPGRYHMVALPLNLQHADGAPTRVILMDEK